MQINFTSIGIIHSPFKAPKNTPIQASRSSAEGWVEVFPEYLAGLQDIDEFSHLILLYAFHRVEQTELLVKPFLDDEKHGIFSTRHPNRPNPIGLSVVEFIARAGNRLQVRGVDVLDGTPLLDIKPYMAEFDVRENVRSGWYERRARP